MTIPRRFALAALTGLLILIDGALAGIGLLVESGHRRGNLTGSEAATFVVAGVSAVVGMVVLFLVMVAFVRGTRGNGIAKVASSAAWLRAAGVLVALTAVAASLGIAAIVGPFESFGASVAVFDALIGCLAAAGVTWRLVPVAHNATP